MRLGRIGTFGNCYVPTGCVNSPCDLGGLGGVGGMFHVDARHWMCRVQCLGRFLHTDMFDVYVHDP